MYPHVFTKEGNCGVPQNSLGLGPLKALIQPWLGMRDRSIVAQVSDPPVAQHDRPIAQIGQKRTTNIPLQQMCFNGNSPDNEF